MADTFKENRKEYTVNINGVDHTMLLSADDADRWGEAAKPAAKKAATKARTPANK